ncbi:MAG TPA: hypothetical protein VLF18_15430 [Tahibacter sp.]|uniref:hypothetical protein n=1 Tax=Tahibacter sp. TaxID=2056211 RepID=UPI002C6206E7|nr:hypothetical protein [Tahibacter sp.]HSX61592.1 hypothetical protein [Tahibacter sp.]
MLFIVGETLTYGIQRKALDAALWRATAEVANTQNGCFPQATFLLRRLSAKPKQDAAKTTYTTKQRDEKWCEGSSDPPNFNDPTKRHIDALVVGPYFSGSVEGLSQAASTLHERLARHALLPLTWNAKLRALRSSVDAEEARNRKYSVAADSSKTRETRDSLASLRTCLDALELQSSEDGQTIDTKKACGISAETTAPPSTKKQQGVHKLAQELERALTTANEKIDTVRVTVHALSATATATSNEIINRTTQGYFDQQTIAINDQSKLCAALTQIHADRESIERVAMIYEPTAFGREAYRTLQRIAEQGESSSNQGCGIASGIGSVTGFDFPPNISDLRQKLRDGDKQAREKLALVSLATDNSHLPIEEGVENGNEYPDGAGSKLAAVGAEQRLRFQLNAIANEKPTVIIVVASDVRDRLYLFDRLSRTNADAALVDLEADILLAHPDYLHATRGIRMVSSSPLSHVEPTKSNAVARKASYLRQFDSDRSALLFKLMHSGEDVSPAMEPSIYRVGRRGPVLDQGNDSPMWSIYSGLADGFAWFVALLALGYCAMQLFQSIQETRTAYTPNPANAPVIAPWWSSGLLRPRDAAGLATTVTATVLIVAIVVPFSEYRSTHLGFVGLALLILLAAAAQIFWYVIARKLRYWTRHIELLMAASGAKELADWASVPGAKPNFVATPILAGSYWVDDGLAGRTKLTPTQAMRQLVMLEFGFQDSLALRFALRRLLLPGLRATFRLACVSSAACLAIVLITVLYPVPQRSTALVAAFVLLLSGTWLLTTHTIAYERNGLLSRLFCGTTSGLQISAQFVTTLAGPATLLILSLILADQPGVMDTAGGLLKWLATAK